MVRKKRKKRSEKVRPNTVKHLVMSVRKNKPIDQRTKAGKSIQQIKQAVRLNLDEAARALLESDIANSATIQAMALEVAYRDPSKIINADGSYHKALGTWLKFANVKKSALLALKKFQMKEPQEDDNKGLAEMVLEVSEEDVLP
jgi:hypothetical protein